MSICCIGAAILLGISWIGASRVSLEPAAFVATSPCDQIPRSMLAIPATADCEMIQWELALYRDPRNQNPTNYKLQFTYGRSKPSTTDFINGIRGLKEGPWAVVKEPAKTVYRLNPVASEPSISFVRLDEKVLHLLDADGKLMIGHGGWSYTLNRKPQ